MQMGNRIRSVALAGWALLASGSALALGSECGDPFHNATGPFDYRYPEGKMLGMVEHRHYTEDIRQLRRGTTGALAGDLAYTLRVFPNHYRALQTMSEWSFKTRSKKPEGQPYVVECWFERGLHYAPDDPMVKLVYGIHLIKAGRPQDAVKQLEAAIAEDPNNASSYYNLGLAYADLKDYEKALPNAQRAYELGFPLPGLRQRLVKAGVWREPEPKAPEQGATGENKEIPAASPPVEDAPAAGAPAAAQ
ncbi:tetratricopeptide repeat protein [Azoarcus indigens]|uniref:Tetratricopeptide repeat protein n=1 Tax=Azoarcus indigens TaxID=29545 RepID=A0A4R6E7B4_9RHOO|nr:tetratricopeptide repeat protein [Azoarcus indigens]NMG63879.1 tetratricopeptide repeat protein [Azoarcus indigens]TDN53846.1 tetratricopeptide repeat protein [Azoarcus indigens]